MQRRLARQPLEFQPRTARLELAKEDVPARIIWYQRWDINSKPKIAVPDQVLGDRCGCLSPVRIYRYAPFFALTWLWDRAATERDNARRVRR